MPADEYLKGFSIEEVSIPPTVIQFFKLPIPQIDPSMFSLLPLGTIGVIFLFTAIENMLLKASKINILCVKS